MMSIGLSNLNRKPLNSSRLFQNHLQFLYADIAQEGKQWVQKNQFTAIAVAGVLGPALMALPFIIANGFLVQNFNQQIIISTILSGLVVASSHSFSQTWKIHIVHSYVLSLPLSKLYQVLVSGFYQIAINALFLLICLVTVIFNFYSSLKGGQESIFWVLMLYVTVILWSNHYLNIYLGLWSNKLICLTTLSYLVMNNFWILLSAALTGLYFITQHHLHFPPKLKYRGRSLIGFMVVQPGVLTALVLYICIWLLELTQPDYFQESITVVNFLIVIIIGSSYSQIVGFYQQFKQQVLYLPAGEISLKKHCILAISSLFALICIVIVTQYIAITTVSFKLMIFTITSMVLGLIFSIVNDKARIPIQFTIMIIYFLDTIS